MLYTITPEQEKAALHELIMRFDDETQSHLLERHSLSNLYLLEHHSLSNLVNDDVVPLYLRQDIVQSTLWNLSCNSFLNSDTSYSNLKNHFAKYANQSLVGTIAGVSITPQDFHKLITNDNDDNGYENSRLFVNSLPFSFMNEIADYDQLFKGFLDNDYRSYPEILTLNHYKLTDEQYKSMFKYSYCCEPGFLPLFAACPQTKHLVTEKDLADVMDIILQVKSHLIEDLHNDLYLEFINDITEDINGFSVFEYKLAEIYRDLFGNDHLTEEMSS